ncbi:hypothetical protein U9M48_028074 [Paspalum notatum var. saurae]|uniref:HAT C-terminal dimerisation domain-containing protein n=1 Tax=Paspalum notatum var. saurae TaxID=547442 RepID=A0AAQ3U0C5_PASNO
MTLAASPEGAAVIILGCHNLLSPRRTRCSRWAAHAAVAFVEFDVQVRKTLSVLFKLYCKYGLLPTDINKGVKSFWQVVFQYAKNRPVFFSSFHPDAARMMRELQSLYPFTEEYPNKPPTVRFVSRMFHPNNMTTLLERWMRATLSESTIQVPKPQESDAKPTAKSYEVKSGIIELAAKLSFSGADLENPYKRLEKLSEICHIFQQDGAPVEWVKWNLFPFTLVDKAQKWYQRASREAQGDWGLLVEKFVTTFFSTVRVYKLRKQVWSFEQKESEDIDEAGERLNDLLSQVPNLGVTSNESLSIFYYGITSEASRYADMCTGGSLMDKTVSEVRKILSNICLTSKEERERREREAKGAEVAPTVEAQLPTFHTPVSFAFDEDLHWMTADFGELLKSEGSLQHDQSTCEMLPKWFKPNQKEMLKTTPQKRSVSMFEEKRTSYLPSTGIVPPLPPSSTSYLMDQRTTEDVALKQSNIIPRPEVNMKENTEAETERRPTSGDMALHPLRLIADSVPALSLSLTGATTSPISSCGGKQKSNSNLSNALEGGGADTNGTSEVRRVQPGCGRKRKGNSCPTDIPDVQPGCGAKERSNSNLSNAVEVDGVDPSGTPEVRGVQASSGILDVRAEEILQTPEVNLHPLVDECLEDYGDGEEGEDAADEDWEGDDIGDDWDMDEEDDRAGCVEGQIHPAMVDSFLHGEENRKFRSKVWKEFSKIRVAGIVTKGWCMHYKTKITARRGAGTSAMRTHLKRCRVRKSITNVARQLKSAVMSPEGVALENWRFSQDVSRKELARMISLHGFPLSIVDYDGFRRAFESLAKQDQEYTFAPLHQEWEMIWEVKDALENEFVDLNPDLLETVQYMQRKLKKYWKLTWLQIMFPVIFDPRFKLAFVEFRLKQSFGSEADSKISTMKKVLLELFKGYSQVNLGSQEMTQQTALAEVLTNAISRYTDWDHHISCVASSRSEVSSDLELETYLVKPPIPRSDTFDILAWWKSNSSEYPTLPRMARDILAVPASMVASESAFSMRRIISDFRSRLTSKTVEALICLQD